MSKLNNYKSKEIEEFVIALEKYKLKVTQTPETAKKFLFELGVINKKGTLTKNYKNLCIPEEQE